MWVVLKLLLSFYVAAGALLSGAMSVLSPNHGPSPGRAAGMQAQSSEPLSGRHSSQFCLHDVQLTCHPLFSGQRAFRVWGFWLSLDLKTKQKKNSLKIEVSVRPSDFFVTCPVLRGRNLTWREYNSWGLLQTLHDSSFLSFPSGDVLF